MPELEPVDPTAALKKMRRLPPLTTIKVLRVAVKQQSSWYFVEATSPSKFSLGSGWINGVALMGQGQVGLKEQLKKQAELENRLKDEYEDKLAEKYGLTREQLERISIEGIEKDWPFPKMEMTLLRRFVSTQDVLYFQTSRLKRIRLKQKFIEIPKRKEVWKGMKYAT